jgi:hypothetical protein
MVSVQHPLCVTSDAPIQRGEGPLSTQLSRSPRYQ